MWCVGGRLTPCDEHNKCYKQRFRFTCNRHTRAVGGRVSHTKQFCLQLRATKKLQTPNPRFPPGGNILEVRSQWKRNWPGSCQSPRWWGPMTRCKSRTSGSAGRTVSGRSSGPGLFWSQWCETNLQKPEPIRGLMRIGLCWFQRFR